MKSFFDDEGRCSQVFHDLGECYHLWTSENFELIFCSDDDYRAGMNIIGICARLFPEIKILTFELMSNHIHFAIAGERTIIHSFFDAVNCHGSYLPDYRGSRAYMHYWANFSEYYGATIHYLTDKIDDGNILIRGKLQMFKDESHDSVFIRTAELCGHLLPAAILMIEKSDAGFIADGQKRYFCKMTPDEFEKHRKQNEKLISEGKDPILTRHKVLK